LLKTLHHAEDVATEDAVDPRHDGTGAERPAPGPLPPSGPRNSRPRHGTRLAM